LSQDVTENTPPVEHAAGVMSKPATEKLKLLFVFALLGLAIYFSRPTVPSLIVGFILVMFGNFWRIWAGGHLTRNKRLAVSGPYEYTRNPFYLGRFLYIIGFACMAGLGFRLNDANPDVARVNIVLSIIFAVAIIVFFGVYMPRKEQREGDRLLEIFGDEYATYRQNVPPLFPRFSPYRTNPRPWSKDLFLGKDETFGGNKEHWTILSVLLIAALFLVRYLTLPPQP
jgi:protein-S-isoprenylcysteine O-methyltransferase Ste14